MKRVFLGLVIILLLLVTHVRADFLGFLALTATKVPEPSTLIVFGFGMVGVKSFLRWRAVRRST